MLIYTIVTREKSISTPWSTHNCIEGSMRDPFPTKTQNAIPIKLSITPALKRYAIATHHPSSALTELSNVT